MNDTSRAYDVVVVGAGPAGENVADRTRAAGLTSVIVENELLGGECSFWACEPSKALLRPVVARADARRVPGLRRAVQGPLDVPAVFAHRDKMAAYWKDDDQVDWLKSVGGLRPLVGAVRPLDQAPQVFREKKTTAGKTVTDVA